MIESLVYQYCQNISEMREYKKNKEVGTVCLSYLSEASVSGQVLNGNRYDFVTESNPDEAPTSALHRPDLVV